MENFLQKLKKLKHRFRIDLNKNTKLVFYLKGIAILLAPKFLYTKNLEKKYKNLDEVERKKIDERVSYYNKIEKEFTLDANTKTIKEFIWDEKKRTYYFDLLEYIKYFEYSKKISYVFGDVTYVPDTPSIVKSRPIGDNNHNSVLMKLNKVRHFVFVDDKQNFEDKISKAVWRGKCHKEYRKNFVQKFFNHSMCNIGQVNTKVDIDKPWQKKRLSLKEQLRYKYLISIEGNDVASNLKWAMSANSLVLMAKPKFETWFMEAMLKENYHYVLLKDDYSDLEEKMIYYNENVTEAKAIISNAHNYVQQFKNQDYEDIISYKVLEKFFKKQRDEC